jgi:hypothetical protein
MPPLRTPAYDVAGDLLLQQTLHDLERRTKLRF